VAEDDDEVIIRRLLDSLPLQCSVRFYEASFENLFPPVCPNLHQNAHYLFFDNLVDS
jgi:hypothetical protein